MQNLLVLRFANTIFERLWGSRNVEPRANHGGRERGRRHPRRLLRSFGRDARHGAESHAAGALHARDGAAGLARCSAIRESKLNVLRALRPISLEDAARLTVRARYGAGHDGRQARCPATCKKKASRRNRRPKLTSRSRPMSTIGDGQGCRFSCATANGCRKRESVIAVQFKDAPKILFNRNANLPPNVLMIRIQPDEGFSFDVMAKRPGLGLAISPVRMNLHYEAEFGKDVSPDAYERLLLDVMAGDSTLFPSDTFVEKSWEFIQGILDAWKDEKRVR